MSRHNRVRGENPGRPTRQDGEEEVIMGCTARDSDQATSNYEDRCSRKGGEPELLCVFQSKAASLTLKVCRGGPLKRAVGRTAVSEGEKSGPVVDGAAAAERDVLARTPRSHQRGSAGPQKEANLDGVANGSMGLVDSRLIGGRIHKVSLAP
ncbi:hypothetical protein MTO96_048547 [Rhipicephalus appendiculatus]